MSEGTPVQTRPSITRPGHDAHPDVDEDLVDFLERHEAGPCPDCPLDVVLDWLEAIQ